MAYYKEENIMNKTRKMAMQRLVITAIIVMLGVGFLWNLRDYAIEHYNMIFASENAEKIGWTDALNEEYDEAQSNIVNSANPLVRMCYYHNSVMSIITVAIAVITFASVMYIGYIVNFIKKDITRSQNRKKRRA